MKKTGVVLAVVLLAATGCETMDDGTKKGAGIGALTGAALGGIIGHQDGHGWEGALIGGAAGAVAGGVIGNQMDDEAKTKNSEHISLVGVVDLTKSGLPADEIISQIKASRSRYKLTAEMIKYLQDNNVDNKVIDYMLKT